MKIALVELSESHEECLFSQVKILQSANIETHLFVHPKVSAQLNQYNLEPEYVFHIKPERGLFMRWTYAISLAKVLGKYDKLVFNTASSSKLLRNLTVLLNLYDVECLGIVHNTKKLKSSFTQRLISIKVKKYFVLADHLIKSVDKTQEFKVRSFYPIFFPNYSYVLEKPKNEIWVAIPGAVDFARRDYLRLLNALHNVPWIKKLKIILLGKLNDSFQEGKILMEEISKRELDHYFIFFESFVQNATFHTYLRKIDYIMPLLTLNNDYLNHKISGSFNLAFAYKKPMISHEFFSTLPDVKDNAIFYKKETLCTLLENLERHKSDNEYYKDRKWSFSEQKIRYLELLSSENQSNQ